MELLNCCKIACAARTVKDPMPTVRPCPLPDVALLQRYAAEGGYADCYAAVIPGVVPQAAFVEALYTTRLFRTERLILVPKVDKATGRKSTGWAFTVLLGFHRLYSRLLLRAAVARLLRRQ